MCFVSTREPSLARKTLTILCNFFRWSRHSQYWRKAAFRVLRFLVYGRGIKIRLRIGSWVSNCVHRSQQSRCPLARLLIESAASAGEHTHTHTHTHTNTHASDIRVSSVDTHAHILTSTLYKGLQLKLAPEAGECRHQFPSRFGA
jgi:hypothetical protein